MRRQQTRTHDINKTCHQHARAKRPPAATLRSVSVLLRADAVSSQCHVIAAPAGSQTPHSRGSPSPQTRPAQAASASASAAARAPERERRQRSALCYCGGDCYCGDCCSSGVTVVGGRARECESERDGALGCSRSIRATWLGVSVRQYGRQYGRPG